MVQTHKDKVTEFHGQNGHPDIMSRLTDAQFPVSPVQARLVTLTPRMCQDILDAHNTHNRTLSETLVIKLASDMAEGRWKVNGETVVFASDGSLHDGQHRFAAAIMANLPLTTMAVFGIDPSTFDTVDRGRKRTTGDDLSILKEENTNILAAICNLIKLEEDDRLEQIGFIYPSAVVQDVLDRHPDVRVSCKWLNTFARAAKGRITPRILGFGHYRFTQSSPTQVDDFFEHLVYGLNLTKENPVYSLHKQLEDNKTARSKLPAHVIMALMIKAWNAFKTGSPLRIVAWRNQGDRPELFPTIR